MAVIEQLESAARRLPRSIYFRLAALMRPRSSRFSQIRYQGHELLVLLNEDVGWRLRIAGTFEPHELDALCSLVREDDVCVDVGCNIGIYSVFLGARASKGAVIAFEPNPVCVHMTALNAWLNGLTNVRVVQSALSDAVGSMSLSLASDSAYSSLRDTGRKPAVGDLSVPSTTLDREFASQGKRVDILKVDVEGGELSVLRGGKALLSSPALRPRVILVEMNPGNQKAFGYGPERVVEQLRAAGYEAWSVTPRGVVQGWPMPNALEDVIFRPRAGTDARQ